MYLISYLVWYERRVERQHVFRNWSSDRYLLVVLAALPGNPWIFLLVTLEQIWICTPHLHLSKNGGAETPRANSQTLTAHSEQLRSRALCFLDKPNTPRFPASPYRPVETLLPYRDSLWEPVPPFVDNGTTNLSRNLSDCHSFLDT